MASAPESDDSDLVMISHDDIKDYNDEMLPLAPEELASIRTWLRPTATLDTEMSEYRRHLASHLSSTGHWLGDSPSFKQWHDDDNDQNLLWVKGVPGSGKSVLAASLIRRLASVADPKKGVGAPVLFFFFRQIIQANHTPAALLRDWLCQLLPSCPPLQVRLRDLAGRHRRIEGLTMDNLWEELERAVTALPKVYFIVDGLDEMDGGNDVFLQRVAALSNRRHDSPESQSRLKVVVASRPIADIEDGLRQVPKLEISLDPQLVDQDITTYVEARLATAIPPIPQPQQDRIREDVPRRASGLFLYAKLVMDALLRKGAHVESVLARLPADLDALYENLLHEHALRSGVPRTLQLAMLSWVTHAARPLRLLELAAAIKDGAEQSMGIGSGAEAELDFCEAKELVRAALGPLIEILPDDTVSVIHHSLTEFLKDPKRRLQQSRGQPGSYPVLDKGPTHSLLARSCLYYMLQPGILGRYETHDDDDDDDEYYDDDEDPEHMSILMRRYKLSDPGKWLTMMAARYPFGRYCFDHVWYHVGMAEANSDALAQDMLNMIEDVVTEENRAALAHVDRANGQESVSRQTSIHFLARKGLGRCLGVLLDKGVGGGRDVVDSFDSSGMTPLLLAASLGHAGVVKTLLAHGADPDKASTRTGYRPLHEAAMNDHGPVVDLLLSAGVDPLTGREKKGPGSWDDEGDDGEVIEEHTALMYAMKQGRRSAAAAFMCHIKDAGAVSRALAWASEGGDEGVVRIVLGHEAVDVNSKVCGDTPLFLAVKNHRMKAALALLEAGADPSIMSKWAKDEFAVDVENLDEEGIELHRRQRAFGASQPLSQCGFNALHALCGTTANRWDLVPIAGEGGWKASVDEGDAARCMTKMLQTGMDINVPDEYGETPIRLASRWSPRLLNLLLSTEVGINVEDDMDLLDLVVCLEAAESPDIVRVLSQRCKDAWAIKRSSDGMTPLLVAVQEARHVIIMVYLHFGADPHDTDARGRGALHIYLEQLPADRTLDNDGITSDEVVGAFLKAGLSLNSRDHEGNMPIHRFTAVESHEKTLRNLVAAGADINAPDGRGRTLLLNLAANAVAYQVTRRHFEILVAVGASLDIRDHDGCNVLAHYLTQTKLDEGVIDFLVTHGADPHARDNDGNTLWHRAIMSCPSPGSSHLGALEKLGVDVEAHNHLGQSPRHLLAAWEGSSAHPPWNWAKRPSRWPSM